MSRSLKENLLRSFFSHSAEAGIKLSQGRVEGILLRRNIIRALSDITLADTSPVPLEPAPHADAVLEILEQYGIEHEGRTALPVFDSTYQLQHFWGRAEIIKAFEAIPTISAWQPPKVERPASSDLTERPVRARLYDLFVPQAEKVNAPAPEMSIAQDKLPPQNRQREDVPAPTSALSQSGNKKPLEIKINLKRGDTAARLPDETAHLEQEGTSPLPNLNIAIPKTEIKQNPPTQPHPETPVTEQPATQQPSVTSQPESSRTPVTPMFEKSLLKRVKAELEHGKLAILALEALGLPLLAIDLEGNEFFHNQEWNQLLARYGSRFEPTEIRQRAQDVIAQRALQGNLDVEDTIELPGLLKGRSFFLRTIRVESGVSRTIGYLIWAEQGKVSFSAPIPTAAAGKGTHPQYLGRTLTEILAEEEKKALFWAYEQADGNQSNAAMLLGIPRQTYAYRLKKFLHSEQKEQRRIRPPQHDATADHAGELPKNRGTE